MAWRVVQEGFDVLANAVKVTLGPKGRNVIISKSFGAPTVTKDGVTVAKEVELADAHENMGAQMVKEVASKTNDLAGDGTTTATVLAQAIVREGLKNVAAGANPMDLKRGIDKAVKSIVNELAKQSQKHSWQLTATWYLNFCNQLLSFNGFADFWGDRRFSDGRNIAIFLAEPQFWVNLNRIKGVSEDFKLSLGTEWEVSNNFVNQNHRWYWLPTLAAKWTF